jgi:hypothetical protein
VAQVPKSIKGPNTQDGLEQGPQNSPLSNRSWEGGHLETLGLQPKGMGYFLHPHPPLLVPPSIHLLFRHMTHVMPDLLSLLFIVFTHSFNKIIDSSSRDWPDRSPVGPVQGRGWVPAVKSNLLTAICVAKWPWEDGMGPTQAHTARPPRAASKAPQLAHQCLLDTPASFSPCPPLTCGCWSAPPAPREEAAVEFGGTWGQWQGRAEALRQSGNSGIPARKASSRKAMGRWFDDTLLADSPGPNVEGLPISLLTHFHPPGHPLWSCGAYSAWVAFNSSSAPYCSSPVPYHCPQTPPWTWVENSLGD